MWALRLFRSHSAAASVPEGRAEYRRQNPDASGTLFAEVSCLSVNRQTEARELIIGCAGLLFVALLLCRFENLSRQICAEIFSIAPVIVLLRHVFY